MTVSDCIQLTTSRAIKETVMVYFNVLIQSQVAQKKKRKVIKKIITLLMSSTHMTNLW